MTTAIVCATGPSFAKDIPLLRELGSEVVMCGVNNVYRDLPLDVHTACDPAWWKLYGHEAISTVRDAGGLCYHYDQDICEEYGAVHLPGKWGDGISTNKDYIHYGHSSGYQLLNIAYHYDVERILLVGFDMKYEKGKPRHYFNGMSDKDGEYPNALRKYSTFDGLIKCYKTVADQDLDAEIINCTPGSEMPWFTIMTLNEAVSLYL